MVLHKIINHNNLVVPDEVGEGVVLVEHVVEEKPILCTLHVFAALAQHDGAFLVLGQPGRT